MNIEFGVIDHIDRQVCPPHQTFDSRLKLMALYDQAGFSTFHVTEHHFTPLGLATDILAHEAGHAILESEIEMGFDGQEGALHESFGDVVASLVDPDDWQIGEDAFTPGKPGDALRDLSKPQKYSNMDQVKGSGGEPHLLADIPNLAFTIGYTNASWTLKADLVAEYVCRLLNHMDANGYDICAPHLSDPSITPEPIMDFNSGYVLRSVADLPKQGSKEPWKLRQNYAVDLRKLRYAPLEDGALQFRHKVAAPEKVAA